MDLTSLLPHVRQGDPLAWEAFVRQFQGRIYGLAYHYTGHAEDARDLAQDVFVRVYQNLHLLPEDEGCLTWLLRITRNACIDHLRRRKARPPLWDLPAEDLFDLRSSDPGPLEQEVAESRKAAVLRGLQGLTDLNREILLLKEIHGLSVEAIARMLDVPVGTVKSRSHRARLELAGRLAAVGMEG